MQQQYDTVNCAKHQNQLAQKEYECDEMQSSLNTRNHAETCSSLRSMIDTEIVHIRLLGYQLLSLGLVPTTSK